MISALYNIVDQIFIGNSELSTLGNAATGVVFPVFVIAQAFAWCFGDGCATYLNICQGKNNAENAHKAIGTGVTMTLFAAIIVMAVLYPLKYPALTLFGASENTLEMAAEYLDIILAFLPAFMLMNMMTSVIRADLPENTVQALSSAAGLGFDENSPRLASLQALSRQYEYASLGYSAAVWPRVGLTGGAYWEYPNGPLQEDVFLGRAGVSVRLPLFEGGKNKQQARAQRQTAQAVQENRAELEKNLEALFYSSRDRLASLDVEEDLARQLVAAAQKSAALTYEAYKAGSVTFLEVDDANLSLLQSRIALSDLYIQRLNSLAVMDNLGR